MIWNGSRRTPDLICPVNQKDNVVQMPINHHHRYKEDFMVLILPHAPLSPEEHPTNTEGQSTQVSHITPPRSLFTNPYAQRSLPYPFLLQFLTFSPMVNG